MTIKVWDYLRELEEEREDLLAGIEQVLRSGQLILGPSVKAFESAFAEFCQTRHCIGVDNATNGLFLALKALNIGPGDEVITVPNTAVPTVSAIVSAGATPVFVDIHPRTYLMDVGQLEGAISPRTRAIIPVHLYGQCVDMDALLPLARSMNLAVIEDCAQAHGAAYKGRKAGSLGDAGVFSFYPTKVLGTYGDGGAITTSDDELAARLRRLRFYGMEKTYYAEEHGYNSRLDELHAEILLRKLKRLDGYIARRRDIAQRYAQRLDASPLLLPRVAEGNEHVWYLYVVRHRMRDWLIEEMGKREIALNVSYRWPIHLMRGYQNLGYREGELPVAEQAAREIFSLPMFPTLQDEEQETVCRELLRLLASDGPGRSGEA